MTISASISFQWSFNNLLGWPMSSKYLLLCPNIIINWILLPTNHTDDCSACLPICLRRHPSPFDSFPMRGLYRPCTDRRGARIVVSPFQVLKRNNEVLYRTEYMVRFTTTTTRGFSSSALLNITHSQSQSQIAKTRQHKPRGGIVSNKWT